MSSRRLDTVALLAATLLVSGCVMPGITATSREPSDTVQVADAAWAVGDLEEAARLYELAATRESTSVEPLIGLGKSYTAMGQYSRASNALARAKSLSPRNPEVDNQLGNLALQEMRPRVAIEHFDRALSRDRNNLTAATGKAVSLDYLSRHTEAQDVYRTALKSHPTNFPLLSNYALSQVLSGQIGSGIKLMEELLRDPTNGDTVRANMAIAYALDGRERDARAMLTGIMSEAEIQASLKLYRSAREGYLAGKPVGYLIFK